MTSVISALDCQLETSTGRQTEWSYIIKKNPDEIKTLAPCLVMHDYNAMIGLPCSSVAHTLCRNKKSYSCTGTVTFNIPHHSAAPLRPVSDYRTLLSPQKNTKTNVISQTSCQTAFRSRCTAPCWVNTVRHTHTHTLCRASTAFLSWQIFFPRHCSCVVAFEDLVSDQEWWWWWWC